MSTNDGWGWYTSKFGDMAGKKDEESWLYFSSQFKNHGQLILPI